MVIPGVYRFMITRRMGIDELLNRTYKPLRSMRTSKYPAYLLKLMIDAIRFSGKGINESLHFEV